MPVSAVECTQNLEDGKHLKKKDKVKRIFLATALTIFGLVAAAISPTLSGEVHADVDKKTELFVEKKATAHLVKEFDWEVDKKVKGNHGEKTDKIDYNLTATKREGRVYGYIDGEICITNAGYTTVKNLVIIDKVFAKDSDVVIVTISVDMRSKSSLTAGETFCYPYAIGIPDEHLSAGKAYVNAAHVSFAYGHGNTWSETTAHAKVQMPEHPYVVNDKVTVDETGGHSWTFDKNASVDYQANCDCSQKEHYNAVVVRETGKKAESHEPVKCFKEDEKKHFESDNPKHDMHEDKKGHDDDYDKDVKKDDKKGQHDRNKNDKDRKKHEDKDKQDEDKKMPDKDGHEMKSYQMPHKDTQGK